MIQDLSRNGAYRMFGILGVDPSRQKAPAAKLESDLPRGAVIAPAEPDAAIKECVSTMGSTLAKPGQKISVLAQTLSELGMLGEFAIAALPQVAMLITHKDAQVARPAVQVFTQLAQMAIHGSDVQGTSVLSHAMPTLVDAFAHGSAEVQGEALRAYGALGVAAAGRGHTELAAKFAQTLSQVAVPASSRRFVRACAEETRQTLDRATFPLVA